MHAMPPDLLRRPDVELVRLFDARRGWVILITVFVLCNSSVISKLRSFFALLSSLLLRELPKLHSNAATMLPVQRQCYLLCSIIQK